MITDKKANFFIDFFYQGYSYREYIKQSVLRDLRTKYKRSVLGYFWTMLHPLAMMSILTVVFSHIMRIGVKDYAVFLFAGLLTWNYFSSTAMMSLGNIRANSRLIGLIPIPKYIFIVSLSISNLVNLILTIIPLLIIMIAVNHPINATILLFPLILLPIFFVTMAVSLLFATCHVFFDDTLHLAEVGMQALYFLSPVLYHRELLPAGLVRYLVLNPIFCQVEFMRKIFYDGVFPDPLTFGINLAFSLIIFMFSLWIFRRAESKFLYFI